MATYVIQRTMSVPLLDGNWMAPEWSIAQIAEISHFHRQSSDHRPRANVKALYDNGGIHLIFDVADRYVRCVHTQFQDSVCRDSCVEFFVQPAGSPGYFNFEFNCGGSMLLMYIVDPTRNGRTFKEYIPVSREVANLVRVFHSMPTQVNPEITGPINWRLQAYIPFGLFDAYCPGPVPRATSSWRGNFYKCGDDTSHPHWASWNPIGSELNFHAPGHFGNLLLI